MATPPVPARFRKQDYGTDGLGSQDAVEKFFQQLNAHTEATRKALTGGITLGDNANAEFKQITINTPATDWVSVPDNSLAANWTTFSGAFRGVQYRKDATGRVTWGGLLKCSAPVNYTTIFTPPAAFLPASLNAWIGSVSAGNASATDSFASFEVSTQYGLRYRSGANATSYVSLENISYYCADLSPGVLSCFPIAVSTKVATPKAVHLASVVDTASSTTPLALGVPHYTVTGSGKFTLKNIPGLLLGRKYTITLLILGG